MGDVKPTPTGETPTVEPVTITIAAAVLVAIVEIVKRTVNAWVSPAEPPDPDRYVPALTVVLGVAGGAAGIIDAVGWFGGLIAALTAAGVYGGTKATARGLSR